MDWIFNGINRLIQSAVWRSVLVHAQWIDWLACLFVLAGLIYGIRKGFMSILGRILQLMVVVTLTLEFYGKLNALVKPYLGNIPPETAKPIAFVAAGIVFWLLVGLIAKYLAKIISAQTSSLLKILGGALGGAFYGFLLLSFISQALMASSFENFKKVYDEKASYTGFALARMAPKLHRLVTRPIQSANVSPPHP